jgi:hypothetical protein
VPGLSTVIFIAGKDDPTIVALRQGLTTVIEKRAVAVTLE